MWIDITITNEDSEDIFKAGYRFKKDTVLFPEPIIDGKFKYKGVKIMPIYEILEPAIG